MRLINTTTYKVEEFVGDAVLQYVILSHTWGDDEPSLQDMIKGSAHLKAGYPKIRYCCEQALEDGFQYAWVDTCCIDKTSSAELSEAINSMFGWYKNAQICYVYLGDLDAGDSKGQIPPYCRWLGRGWTLQELLAPDTVEFYDRVWRYQGSKTSLAVSLSEATGIPERLLRFPEYLEQYSVAQIFSWASRRETTRVEDRAYSLLGLFDVNMPLLYGEGDKAFFRLQKKILKTTADTTIFAWSRPQEDLQDLIDCGLLADTLERFRNTHNIADQSRHRLNPVFQPDRILVDLFLRPGEPKGRPAVVYLGRRSADGEYVCVDLIPSTESHTTGPVYRRGQSTFSLKSDQQLHEKGFNLQRLTFSLVHAEHWTEWTDPFDYRPVRMPLVNISLRASLGVGGLNCRIRGLASSWGVYSLTSLEQKAISADAKDMSLAITAPIWPSYEHHSDVRPAATADDDFIALCKVSACLINDRYQKRAQWATTTTICIVDIMEAGRYVAGIVVGLQASDAAPRLCLAPERQYQHDDVYRGHRHEGHWKTEDCLDMTNAGDDRPIRISARVRRQGSPRHSGCKREVRHLLIELDGGHPRVVSTPAEPQQDQVMKEHGPSIGTHTKRCYTLDKWSRIPGLEDIQLNSVAPIDPWGAFDIDHKLISEHEFNEILSRKYCVCYESSKH